jgi:threonine dehydratase
MSNVWPIGYRDVVEAAERIAPSLAPTPLRHYPLLDAAVGHGIRVLVKHENHQPTGAFKVRNALSAMTCLSAAARQRGVVCATRGNHGQGVAWAGGKLGVASTICVPHGNNPEKNAAMRALGATLIEDGRDYDESVAIAQALVADGLHMVHSTNDPRIIAGAGTITLEVVEQAEVLDAMVVAVGGGSQAVGALVVARERCPSLPVYAVQAERASAIHDGWHAGHAVHKDSADTFADGLATRSCYEATFGALREGLAGFVTVSEGDIADAIRLLIEHSHNLAEGAGAAGLAGLRKLGRELAGKTVGIILSGGNIDRRTLERVITGEL